MNSHAVPALPAHFAVRAYLRQHPLNRAKFLSDLASQFGWDCGDAYAAGRTNTNKLEIVATRFREHASTARPFTIVESHVPPLKSLPQRERRSVCAFFMHPIGLAQLNRATNSSYEEQAVILRTLQAQFRHKRAMFGIGTGSLVLTQHVLERIYERTEVHHEEFGTLMDSEFADLLRGVALAKAAGIWIDGRDDHGNYRIGEVPYSNGLIKLEARAIVGDALRGDLGFWIGMASREGRPFVNPASIIQGSIDSERPELMAIEVTCGVTYLSITELRPHQLDYLYAFAALKSEIGTEALDRLADAYCAPHFPHEQPCDLPITDKADALVGKVRALLNSQPLHPSQSAGVCCITASEYARAA